MNFDAIYYCDILALVNDRDWWPLSKWLVIDHYSDTPDKLLFHLKYYIDHCNPCESLDITLCNDYQQCESKLVKFMVTEPFVDNTSMYTFPKPKKSTPLPVAVVLVKAINPFKKLKPQPVQGEINL